ncbi:hypothetical protein NC651_011702 [Populus alba x Populus x berolinensis]|nr:hypothetical protein NC651_011702 [Populus alba x Populus x berolinensis]
MFYSNRIYFKFAFYPNNFFLINLFEIHGFLNPIVDIMLIILMFSILLAFVRQDSMSFFYGISNIIPKQFMIY